MYGMVVLHLICHEGKMNSLATLNNDHVKVKNLRMIQGYAEVSLTFDPNAQGKWQQYKQGKEVKKKPTILFNLPTSQTSLCNSFYVMRKQTKKQLSNVIQ